MAQQEQIQRKSSRVATDLARLSVFKGNLREMEVQQRVDEQAREQNREKKHENTIKPQSKVHGNRKDLMHLFKSGKGDLWNRQKSRQRTKNSVRISKRKSEEPPTTWQFISAKRAGKP